MSPSGVQVAFNRKKKKLTLLYVLLLKQELRAHMALVTRSEEPRAHSKIQMSSSKIQRIDRLIKKRNKRFNAGRDLK